MPSIGTDIEDETDAFIGDLHETIMHGGNRDMDHVRLRILSDSDRSSNDEITNEELQLVLDTLKTNHPDLCQILYSQVHPNEATASLQTLDEFISLKARQTRPIQLLKRTNADALHPLRADMIYRKGRLSNAW